MLRKTLSILIALAMMGTVLVACQPQQAVETPSEEESASAEEMVTVEEPRTLNIIGSVRINPGEEEAWDEVIAAFEEEYGVHVDIRWQGEWNEIPQFMETARLAGEPVDMSSAGAGLINATLARSGIIMDMTEFIDPIKDRWAEGMLLPYTINDKIWGIPYASADTTLIYYNKTIFDELGLSEPTTYAEMVEVAKVVGDEKGIIPMIHDGKAPWFWPIWYFETYAQTTGNKSIDSVVQFLSGEKQFTGEAELAAFDAIAQFYNDGILTLDSLDTDTDAALAVFTQQKAAMFFNGTWRLAPTREMIGDSFEIGVFEFPVIIEGATPNHGGGASDAFVIPSFADPANYDLSRQFLEFITRKEYATKILSLRSPLGPSIASVPPTDTEPLAQELVDEFFPRTITFLDWIWPVEVNDAFVSGIPAVLFGNITAEEAAQGVQDALDTLIEEKDYQFDWWNTWTEEDWAKVTMGELTDIEIKE